MRLWEFPEHYIIEPTDGSLESYLSINRADGTVNIIGKHTSLLLWLKIYSKNCQMLFFIYVLRGFWFIHSDHYDDPR